MNEPQRTERANCSICGRFCYVEAPQDAYCRECRDDAVREKLEADESDDIPAQGPDDEPWEPGCDEDLNPW